MSLRLGPQWLDLMPGIKIKVTPVSRLMARRAVLAMQAASAAIIAAGGTEDDGALAADEAYNRCLAHEAITEWAGDIAGEDGEPAMVTPENIDLLMDQAEPANAFNRVYIMPHIKRALEKNASSPSSTGVTPMAETGTAGVVPNQSGKSDAEGLVPS